MGDYNALDGVLVVPTQAGELKLKRQIVPAIKAAFEDWMEVTARRRVFHLRKQLGEMEYAENMKYVSICSAAGKYRWGGEAFRASLLDLPGAVQLIVLLCREAGQADVDESAIWAAFQNEADRLVLLNALKEVQNANPNFMDPPPEMREAATD